MLKLTLRPGEFIDIGENVRVIFSGGSANNIHLLVDAPKEVNIARSSAGKKKEQPERCLPIRKHRGAREKRYSFGYAVFLILALMK